MKTVVHLAEVVDDYQSFIRLGLEAETSLARWDELVGSLPRTASHHRRMYEAAYSGANSRGLASAERVVSSSADVAVMIDVLASLQSVLDRLGPRRSVGERALGELMEIAEFASQAPLLPPTFARELSEFQGRPIIAGQMDAVYVKLLRNLGIPEKRRLVDFLLARRVQGLHAIILFGAAMRLRQGDELSSGLDTKYSEVTGPTTKFRDSVKALAGQLDGAGPVWGLRLLAAITEFETKYQSVIAPTVVSLLRDVSVRLRAHEDVHARLSGAATAYDAARNGLTALAAGYRLLLAWATSQSAELRAWHAAAGFGLQIPSDLPRTAISQIISGVVTDGTEVEVAGALTVAEFDVTSHRHRSRLTIEDATGRKIVAFVPHAAVDSFGITTGIWCQVRGKLYLDGKDGIPGPVVMVRRERLNEDAKVSFLAFLRRQGGPLFPYRRNGWDILAGRLAANATIRNEMLYWGAKVG